MRSLTITLYLFIMGCLLLAYSVVAVIEADSYIEEVENNYIDYARLIATLIQPELNTDPGSNAKILKHWQTLLGEDVHTIKLVEVEAAFVSPEPFSTQIDITEKTDMLTIIAPLALDTEKLGHSALEITFVSSYSDDYMGDYRNSQLAIYLFMWLVISVVAFVIFRYINRISKVTKAVAAGNFDTKMPTSNIRALNELANDINAMATSVKDKTQDNTILTGAIHHELRIPVTRLRLALDMAMPCTDPEELMSLLQGMDIDLDELTKLMEEILTISRLSMNSETIPTCHLPINEMTKGIVSTMGDAIISLDCKIDFTVVANETLLQRAIFNIVSNAEKYAENTVKVTITQIQGINALIVEDDGPGISEAEREMVLKPFYRTDKSRNRNTGGFGLGLAIANMVVRHTEGIIKIETSHLGGAKITMLWP